jgi:hypothetical protein
MGQRALGGGQVVDQQGTWDDPFAFKDPKGMIQVHAQQVANARALRMGKPIPFPEAESQFHPAPTKEEIQRKQELEDRDFRARQHTEQDELDWLQGEGDRLAAQAEAIAKDSGGHWATPDAAAAYAKLQTDLRALNQDRDKQNGEGGHLTATEWHRKRAEVYADYLGGINPDRDVVPWGDRPGNRETVNGEIWERSRDPNKPDTFIDFEDEPNLTDEDIRAGKSKRFRYYGGVLHQKVRGRQGTEWKEMSPPKTEKSSGEVSPKERLSLIISWQKANTTQDGGVPKWETAKKAVDDMLAEGRADDDSGQPAPGAVAGPQLPSGPPAPPSPTRTGEVEIGGQQYDPNTGLPPGTAGAIPTVVTPEEADALGPEKQFYTPDGRLLQTPPATGPQAAAPPAGEEQPQEPENRQAGNLGRAKRISAARARDQARAVARAADIQATVAKARGIPSGGVTARQILIEWQAGKPVDQLLAAADEATRDEAMRLINIGG